MSASISRSHQRLKCRSVFGSTYKEKATGLINTRNKIRPFLNISVKKTLRIANNIGIAIKKAAVKAAVTATPPPNRTAPRKPATAVLVARKPTIPTPNTLTMSVFERLNCQQFPAPAVQSVRGAVSIPLIPLPSMFVASTKAATMYIDKLIKIAAVRSLGKIFLAV